LNYRSDNCIKNYYYSTLRKHLRKINKNLKFFEVGQVLNLRIKNLTADSLFQLVRDGKVNYRQIQQIDEDKFEDLETTMRMIFNHEEDLICAATASIPFPH
jgi:hypothetical protein